MAKERALVGPRVVVYVGTRFSGAFPAPGDLNARRDAARVRRYREVIPADGSWRRAERARFEIAIARGHGRNVGEVAGRRQTTGPRGARQMKTGARRAVLASPWVREGQSSRSTPGTTGHALPHPIVMSMAAFDARSSVSFCGTAATRIFRPSDAGDWPLVGCQNSLAAI